MKPPARTIVGNLVWSTEGPVWALWRVTPFAHAYATTADQLVTHGRLRGLLIGLPANSMLLSVCERLDPWDVVADMTDGVDLDRRVAWGEVCETTAAGLDGLDLYRRRYYVAAQLGALGGRQGWQAALRASAAELAASFGMSPGPVPDGELEARQRQARLLETALAAHVPMQRPTAGELRWLIARSLRRATNEPALDDSWEPPATSRPGRGVLAPLVEAVIKEGGYRSDPGRPRHRRYVRIDSGDHTTYLTCLAVADMPHEFMFPGGGGEWLYHLDAIGAPIDWCVRIRAVANPEAQVKLRRQHRQLIGQVDEYDGEVTGAPPSLAEAITAVDGQRANLAANPAEPELQATIIFSVAAADLTVLEERAAAIAALFEPHEYGIARPTGGQTALLRSMLPGTPAANVCRDYTQFLLPSDLAAGTPFCGATVGDPRGLLLGLTVGTGTAAPVLFDPTYGPSVGRTASLAAVGALGSGKSYFLKRLCWDTIARGGQVVTIDRTGIGEYARFAGCIPGHTQVVQLTAGSGICLDPLRSFQGDDRVTVTLGFLSLLAGCSSHTEEAAALAEAVHTTTEQPHPRLGDVVEELRRMGNHTGRPDPAARSLARRLDHYRHLGIGQLAFGDGQPVALDADLIVFWAPHLALPDRDSLLNEHLARQMLPEEILGHALLYLVAAVGRRVVFSDPGRFGAALYDEAWALLASPHGQRLVLEGIRDGRKHNGALWLASQHPNDIGTGELVDLLGPRFVFRQAPGAIGGATEFLGITGSDDATDLLHRGLPTGHCLYRDVRDRVGLIEILPPVIEAARTAADTTPNPTFTPGGAPQQQPGPEASRRRTPPAFSQAQEPATRGKATSAAHSYEIPGSGPTTHHSEPVPEPHTATRELATAGDQPSRRNGEDPAASRRGHDRHSRQRRTPLADALARKSSP